MNNKTKQAKRRLWHMTVPWMLQAMETQKMVLVEMIRLNGAALTPKELQFLDNRLTEYRRWVKMMREFNRHIGKSVNHGH